MIRIDIWDTDDLNNPLVELKSDHVPRVGDCVSFVINGNNICLKVLDVEWRGNCTSYVYGVRSFSIVNLICEIDCNEKVN